MLLPLPDFAGASAGSAFIGSAAWGAGAAAAQRPGSGGSGGSLVGAGRWAVVGPACRPGRRKRWRKNGGDDEGGEFAGAF